METWYMADYKAALVKTIQVKIETEKSVILEDDTELSKFTRTTAIFDRKCDADDDLIAYLIYKHNQLLFRAEKLNATIKNLRTTIKKLNEM